MMATASMHTGPWRGIQFAFRFHVRNVLIALRQFSPWVLLVPAIAICLIVLDSRRGDGWFHVKATQEIIAPSILAVAVFVSLLFWARAGDFYSRWLVLLSAALFCRELHFWGTNNGIYFVVLLLLWYASKNVASLRPWLEDRAVVSLVAGAILTYALTKTFDRAYWKFIGGWRDWQDSMEESLESTAHMLVLSTVVVSYVAWGQKWRRGAVRQTPLSTRVKVWGLMAVTVIGAVCSFGHWLGGEEHRPRPRGGFPVELSSLCNVSPELGEDLFLASSDEQHKLTLWTFGAQDRPAVLKSLELNVPMGDGTSLHLDDLEDLAWDGRDTYYAVCSHRHLLPEEDAARIKKSHGTECALVSFQLDRTDRGIEVSNATMLTQNLLPKIRQLGVFKAIDWKSSKAFSWRGMVKTWQLDIEGLACIEGRLLLGFKNPIEDGNATILKYDPETGELAVSARPDLGGHGILGLHYDAPGHRLLVLSNDPIKHHFGDSCLWIGRPSTSAGESWTFAPNERFIIEPASTKTRRKASGVTIYDGRLAVCFDSETDSPIHVIPLDRVEPRF